MNMLGISAFEARSSACLFIDDELICAALEEDFSGIQNDRSFPIQAIQFCLVTGQIELEKVDEIVYFEKPLLRFDRLIEMALWNSPFGILQFKQVMQQWLGYRLLTEHNSKKQLHKLTGFYYERPLKFTSTHFATSWLAYVQSGLERADIINMSSKGEWAGVSLWSATADSFAKEYQLNFPHSLKPVYEGMCEYLDCDELSLINLAKNGSAKHKEILRESCLVYSDEDPWALNLTGFSYLAEGLRFSKKLKKKLNQLPREESGWRENMASSTIAILEEVVIATAEFYHARSENESVVFVSAGDHVLEYIGQALKQRGPYKVAWTQLASASHNDSIAATCASQSIGQEQKDWAVPSDLPVAPSKIPDELDHRREAFVICAVIVILLGFILPLFRGDIFWPWAIWLGIGLVPFAAWKKSAEMIVRVWSFFLRLAQVIKGHVLLLFSLLVFYWPLGLVYKIMGKWKARKKTNLWLKAKSGFVEDFRPY